METPIDSRTQPIVRGASLVATSVGKAAATFGGGLSINCPLHRHRLEVIMIDVIRSATDRLAIRTPRFLLMDHARFRVENPIHEKGSLISGAKRFSLL